MACAGIREKTALRMWRENTTNTSTEFSLAKDWMLHVTQISQDRAQE